MEQVTKIIKTNLFKIAIFNTLAVSFVYLIPTLSHFFAFPLYYLEPMRLMLILSLAHTTKKNAYIFALTLPFFSFLFSSHPIFLKAAIISAELLINVWLYYFIGDRIRNKFTVMMLSILFAKTMYYGLKYFLITGSFSHLVSIPIVIQVAMTLIFSLYVFITTRKGIRS